MGGYCTSKFAMEAFTDALRVELCNWEMKTILIEPGFFKTTMTEKNVLGSQLDQLWSKLPEDKKLEYGEVFLEKSKWVHVEVWLSSSRRELHISQNIFNPFLTFLLRHCCS